MVEPKIKIAENLDLPIDAITQTFAQIGRKGAGKTYLASMIAEQMLDIKAQVIVIDPIGNWWGLRVDADGKSKGKDIFVIGGNHGDVPLAAEAGKKIAKILAEKNISVVLDISEFRKNERKRFVTDFAEEFYHLKKTHPSAVHIFLEESQKFVPQRVMKDDARMLGAWEDIVRLGRNYGIGSSMISQRPQSINKEVFSQVECLCVLQVTGLHERKALEEWVQEAGEDRKIVGKLPSLTIGEGYVWSPSWLRIFEKVKFNKKSTLDTSATPELGKATKVAKISKVDIKKLREQMSEVIEREQRELKEVKDYKTEIIRLKNELRKKPNPQVDERSLSIAQKKGFKESEELYKKEFVVIKKQVLAHQKIINNLKSVLMKIRNLSKDALPESETLPPIPIIKKHEPMLRIKTKEIDKEFTKNHDIKIDENLGDVGEGVDIIDVPEKLKGGAMKMLGWLEAAGAEGLSKIRLATLSGFSVKGGTFGQYLSKLRRNGWIEGEDPYYITREGLENSTQKMEIPSGQELVNLWSTKFKAGAAKMLRIICDHYPNSITKEGLGEKSGFAPSGGTFGQYLSKLVKNDLVIVEGQEITASDELCG